jgi:hypothetical protein
MRQTVLVNTRIFPFLAALLPMGLMACGGGDGVAATAKKGDAFCKLAEKADAASDDLSDLFDSGDVPDSGDVEDALDDLQKASAAAEKKAPKDIADTVKDVNKNLADVIELFDDNDFDLVAVASDPDFADIQADGQDASDDLEQYLDDKCGIDPDSASDSPDETTGSGDDGSSGGSVPEGFVTAENFLDLYAIGAGVEITDEMKECFAEKTSDISQEDFDAAVNGSPSEAVSTAIGLAILSCDIPFTQS